MDVQIEQHLALEMPLERKLGNRNSCIVSKNRYDGRFVPRHAAY